MTDEAIARLYRHNCRSVSNGKWLIDFWTDATRYAPDMPIGIGFRLNCDRPSPDPAPKVTISLSKSGDGQQSLGLIERPRLREVRTALEWEVKYDCNFSIDRAGIIKPSLEEGKYDLNVVILLSDGTKLEVKEIPVRYEHLIMD